LGGGGHHNAAGVLIEGELQDVRASVMTRLVELLDRQEQDRA
jgi:nanoRNase/pAp phosphatase (c-di-AMP/oligoRNAs hydrolase)